MGSREARHRTGQIVFSTVHPLRRQMPTHWLAGFLVAVATGSGVGLRWALAGQ